MNNSNSLSNYLNRDILRAVQGVRVEQGKTKDGNTYYYVNLVLINGFSYRIFLKDAEAFAFTNAIDLMETNHQVDSVF